MDQKYKTAKEQAADALKFGAAYYGALELMNRRSKKKPVKMGSRTKFSFWDYNPVERVLHGIAKDKPSYYYTGFRAAICTPPGSEEWTKAYQELVDQDEFFIESYKHCPKSTAHQLFVDGVEDEVKQIFSPTIPRDFWGKQRFDKKVFYDLPYPSDDASDEAKAYYLKLKKLIDDQNEELKDFYYDEDEIIKAMNIENDPVVRSGVWFEKK